MKKLLLIGSIVAVLALTFGVAGYAYAQNRAECSAMGPRPDGLLQRAGHGPGGMRGEGGCYGTNDGQPGGRGVLREYMFAALAEALDLTPEELQNRIANGETPYTIAQSQGLSDEQISELFQQAHSQALQAAVEAGVITQEQADWMEEHHNQMGSGAFGRQVGNRHAGGCHGGRSNYPPTPQP